MRPPNIVLPADALSFQQCRMARGKRRLHARKGQAQIHLNQSGESSSARLHGVFQGLAA